MPAAPTVCRAMACATSGDTCAGQLGGGHGPVQDVPGPPRLHGAVGDAVALGGREGLLVAQLAAVVVQQAGELGGVLGGAEAARQRDRLRGHPVHVRAALLREARRDQALGFVPPDHGCRYRPRSRMSSSTAAGTR